MWLCLKIEITDIVLVFSTTSVYKCNYEIYNKAVNIV